MTMGYSWEDNRTLSGGFSSHAWLPRIHMPDPWFQHVSIPNLFQTPQATAKAAGYGHLGPELGVMRFSGWVSQISSWLLVKLRVLVILFCIYIAIFHEMIPWYRSLHSFSLDVHLRGGFTSMFFPDLRRGALDLWGFTIQDSPQEMRLNTRYNNPYQSIMEGSLEVKLPTDGKAEVGRVREDQRRERVRRKKMQVKR